MSNNHFKSGFVAIVGRPNVGKSTFMNHAVGQKVAIMSDKAQTTRNRIQGIVTSKEYQIIFMDTPGIHKPDTQLSNFMVESAYSSLKEVEVVLFVIAANEKLGPGDQFIMERLKTISTPVILVVNKLDLVTPEQLIATVETYSKQMDFAEIVPISASEGTNTSTLTDQIVKYLPYGPQYYPNDHVSDHPEYFIVAEFIREKVLLLTQEEVPHSIAVKVDQMQRDENDRIHVYATIIVERSSQKGIVIGKQGKMLKDIGIRARKDIEKMLGEKIFLELWVKVIKGWKNNPMILEEYGYSEKDYKK